MSTGNGLTNNGSHRLPVFGGVPTVAATDNIPPHNLDAERQLLSAMAQENRIIPDVLERLTAADFWRDTHQVLFAAISSLHRRGEPVDGVTLGEHLQRNGRFREFGGDEALHEVLDSAPHPLNWETHAAYVKQHAITREAIQASADTVRDGYSRQFSGTETLERAIARLEAICDGAPGEELDGLRDFPEQPGPAAYHGLLGQIVTEIEPYTEASPAAILFQLVVGMGNMFGPGPHYVHEANKHRLNLYLCLVGTTADGRKGTSWGYAREVLERISPEWGKRIIPGINSGPALIAQVADEERTRQGQTLEGQADKRVLMLETEFTRLLAILKREGETLGMVLRQAWEDDRLAALSKKDPVRATGSHVSGAWHVTPQDLQVNLDLNDIANGLGNRVLWVCSKASKEFTNGEPRFDWRRIDPHIEDLKLSLEYATREIGMDPTPMGRTHRAQAYWQEMLAALRKRRPGLLGAILARGPAQVMRMAAIYAAIDRRKSIDVDHLKAALELWAYSVRSIDFIFGERLGDPDAEKLIEALEIAGDKGLSQTVIQRKVFHGHKDADALTVLLRRMMRAGLIRRELVPNKRSRPTCMWYLDSPPPVNHGALENLVPGIEPTPY